MIVRLTEGPLETRYGLFREVLYYDGQRELIALVKGDVAGAREVLCRVHSSCLRGHAFASVECDCREQFETAQAMIERAGRGVLLWFDEEGRGNGHLALLASIDLKRKGMKQAEAYEALGYERDARSFGRAAEILNDLGVASIVLLTGNPAKREGLEREKITVAGTKKISLDRTPAS